MNDAPAGHPAYRYLLDQFGRPKRPVLVRLELTPVGGVVATTVLYDMFASRALRVAANDA